MIPVIWQNYNQGAPNRGYWDQGFLELLFAGQVWKTPFWSRFKHYDSIKEAPDSATGAIVVLPARYNGNYIKQLNDDLKRFEWVLLIIGGDEENVFEWEKVKHPRIKIWVMTPHPNMHAKADFVLGEGYRKEAPKLLSKYKGNKPTDIFFCGQITHDRRQQCRSRLIDLRSHHPELKTDYTFNTKFAEENLSKEEYYRRMSRAKVVPCPSGPATPSSFRIFEALEAGAVPVADGKTLSINYPDGYWSFIFQGEPPFPVFSDYEQLPGYTQDTIEQYPKINNKVYAWWQEYKRKVAYKLRDTIAELERGGDSSSDFNTMRDFITVIVCSSPIESHPDTAMIEKTIEDVRVQLPDCEILLMLDKARPEYKSWYKSYDQYIEKVNWLCNNQWQNVLPIVFEEFGHQSGNTKAILDSVKTSVMLFVEHDTPITPDEKIEWQGLTQAIISGDANVIRLLHESHILPEHKQMTIGEAENHCGVRMTKTTQWSQRPHLASVAYYRRMLTDYFSTNAKTMIEDKMHGKVLEDFYRDGIQGWYNHRLWIYTPEGNNIKRSYHMDGRGSTPKYDMEF